jgi:hypothetical protein
VIIIGLPLAIGLGTWLLTGSRGAGIVAAIAALIGSVFFG